MPPKAAPARPETVLQRHIRLAVAAGNAPVLSRDRKTLSLQKAGGGKLILERTGRLLIAGEQYYRHRGQRWTSRTVQEVDLNQPISWDRAGRNSFLRGPDGRRHVVTRWSEEHLEGRHTRFGRRYLERSEQVLAVTVPILARVRASGREFAQELAWPDVVDERDEIRALRAHTPEERQTYLRQQLEASPGATAVDGRTLLLSDSELDLFFDPARPFEISEIQVLQGGRAGLADLPAARGAPLQYQFIRGAIHEAAFDEVPDGRCVIHQLAPLLSKTEAQLEILCQESYDLRYGTERLPVVNGEPNAAFDIERNGYADPLTNELAGLEIGVTAQTICDVARRHGVPCRVLDLQGRTIVEYSPAAARTRKAGLFCTLASGHAYFHSAVVAKGPTEIPTRGTVRLRAEAEDGEESKTAYEWLEDGKEADIEEGAHYLCKDASGLRATLLAKGIVPKVALSSTHRIKSLSFGGAWVHQVADSKDHATIEAVLEHAGLPWANCGWGGAAYKIAVEAVRPHRRTIPPSIRQAVRSRGLCELCNEAPGQEIHHHKAVRDGGTNELANLRFACLECHRAVTAKQQESWSAFEPFSSYFSEQARACIEDGAPRAFVHRVQDPPRGGKVQHFDIRGCRRQVLWHAEDPWPIFSVYDEIWPVEGPCKLAPGLYWVDACQGQETLDGDILATARSPLRGRAWYGAPCVKYCLERKLITWDAVKFGIVALGNLPADHFRPVIRRFEDIASAMGRPCVAKQLYCALCGTLSIARSFRYTLVQSECRDEVCTLLDGKEARTCWRAAAERRVFEAVTKEEILQVSSTLPIATYIMEGEACLLARVAEAVASVPTGIPLEYNTDAVLAWSTQHCEERVRRAVLALQHPDGTTVCRTQEPQQLQCPQAYRPGTRVFRPREREIRVYGATDKTQDELLLKTCRIRGQAKTVEVEESVLERAISQGLYVCGAPGTGKSTTCRRILSELDERGLTYATLCPTHAASRVHEDAQTLSSWAHRNFQGSHVPRLKVSHIYVDEADFVSIVLWTLLAQVHLANPGLKFLCSGDHEQLPAPMNTFRGAPVPAGGAEVGLIEALCGDNLLILFQCRRSDEALFDLYTRDPIPTPEELLALIPARGALGDHNLCISNAQRRRLVVKVNEKYATALGAVFCPKSATDEQSTDLWLAPGVELVGCHTGLGLYNNAFYTTMRVADQKVVLRDDDLGGGELEIPLSAVQGYLRGRGALTYHCSQARTLEGRVVLWGMKSPLMSDTYIYLGLSRARALRLVAVNR